MVGCRAPCVITKVDQKMENNLENSDMDLSFPPTKIDIALSVATMPAETIAKIQLDLLSRLHILLLHSEWSYSAHDMWLLCIPVYVM